MKRRIQLELLVMALYIAIFFCMDADKGVATIARGFRWYGSRMRDLGNWSYSQSIRAENAYRELIAP